MLWLYYIISYVPSVYDLSDRQVIIMNLCHAPCRKNAYCYLLPFACYSFFDVSRA